MKYILVNILMVTYLLGCSTQHNDNLYGTWSLTEDGNEKYYTFTSDDRFYVWEPGKVINQGTFEWISNYRNNALIHFYPEINTKLNSHFSNKSVNMSLKLEGGTISIFVQDNNLEIKSNFSTSMHQNGKYQKVKLYDSNPGGLIVGKWKSKDESNIEQLIHQKIFYDEENSSNNSIPIGEILFFNKYGEFSFMPIINSKEFNNKYNLDIKNYFKHLLWYVREDILTIYLGIPPQELNFKINLLNENELILTNAVDKGPYIKIEE